MDATVNGAFHFEAEAKWEQKKAPRLSDEDSLTQVQGGVAQAVSLVGISTVAQQQLHCSVEHPKREP